MRPFLLIALFPLFAFAEEPLTRFDWRFAHPEATLVGGIYPQALLSSPLVAAAIAEAGQQDPSAAAIIGSIHGVLSGIDEIRFSVLDNGTPQPDILALVSGDLDETMVRTIAKDKAKAKRIDASTLLLGNGASLAHAVARMAKTSAVEPHVLAGTESLEGNDIWFSGRLPEAAMTELLAGSGMKVHGFGIGVQVRDSVQVEMAIETATAAMAQKLLGLAAEAEAKQPGEYRGLLHSSLKGTTAHFKIDLPQQLALDAARGGFAAGSAVAAGEAPPEPPKRKTILIQGLADSPREIPLEQRR